jgi:hypothetical protein
MSNYHIKEFENLKNQIGENLGFMYKILEDENLKIKDRAARSNFEDVYNKINIIFLQDLAALHFMDDSEARIVRDKLYSLFLKFGSALESLKASIELTKSFEPSYLNVFENLQGLVSRAIRIVSSEQEFRKELLGESDDDLLSKKLQKEVESCKALIVKDLNNEVAGIDGKVSFLKKELNSSLNSQKSEMIKIGTDFENKLSSIDEQCIELKTKLKNIRDDFDSDLVRVNDLYKEAELVIEDKVTQLDGLLSHASNRVMADDYELSAAEEKKTANWLRFGSLACMTVIIGIVCYSFYDSTHSGFDWESSIFRTVLVFILSIPAAYLSRESTKHREQQYNYHHTALDLKAITPYIASLPEADQNRIKISIAERIFASRQTNVAQQESFPLNTQDLMMELIKKVDFKKEDKKDTQVENAGK